MTETHYDILEIPRTATQEEIKKSYRRLAQKWHPDKNKSPEAEGQFKKINRAYAILKDTDKRADYDYRPRLAEDDVYDDDEPQMTPVEIFDRIMSKSMNETPDSEWPVDVTLEELYTGVTKKITYERLSMCKTCKATGTSIKKKGLCPFCDGRGTDVHLENGIKLHPPCRMCSGKGIKKGAPLCEVCNGGRVEKTERTLPVVIPPGAIKEWFYEIENEGNEIAEDDLDEDSTHIRSIAVFTLNIIPHDTYERGTVVNGNRNEFDLMTKLNISFSESIFGFTKKIKFLDGKNIIVSCDSYVKHGDVYVVKKKGLPVYEGDDDEKGDLFVDLQVEEPKLTATKMEKLWTLLNGKKEMPTIKKSKNIVPFEKYLETYEPREMPKMKPRMSKNKFGMKYDEEDDDDPENCCIQ